jgi:hypothetical protein
MKSLAKSAAAFVAIGLLLYAGVYYAAERLVYRTGDSNPFFKIAVLDAAAVDWVILGASHAMPLDFADFNSVMEKATGKRILNLAAPGAGPLYNQAVFEQFQAKHRTGNLLYVADSFAFYGREWNEDRFADAKLLSRTPFSLDLARRFFDYALRGDAGALAFFDYATGFSKINNRERFQKDVWEGEAQFDRAYRPSATATAKRIAYLYPKGSAESAAAARYLGVLEKLILTARARGAAVTVIKMPIPEMFRQKLPDEPAFDQRLAALVGRLNVPFHDFSSAMDDPASYLDTDHLGRRGVTEFFENRLKTILMGAQLQSRGDG